MILGCFVFPLFCDQNETKTLKLFFRQNLLYLAIFDGFIRYCFPPFWDQNQECFTESRNCTLHFRPSLSRKRRWIIIPLVHHFIAQLLLIDRCTTHQNHPRLALHYAPCTMRPWAIMHHGVSHSIPLQPPWACAMRHLPHGDQTTHLALRLEV